MNINSNFVHPLSEIEVIDTEKGKKKVVNSWGMASMLWATTLEGNPNAMGMTQELFTDKSQIPLLILRSKQGDETATREAIAIMAFALDEKLTEAFELPKAK